MHRALALLAAVAFVAAPVPGAAQDKPAEPAPAPKSGGVGVTPYGFILLNSFWDSATFSAKDYPGQVARTQDGGAFLMSARQSRVGMKLAWDDEAGFTGATLTGVVEFDFKAGHVATACTVSGTTCSTFTAPSSAWYNGVMRLRLAYGQATWNAGPGKVYVGFGQEYGLVSPLFATSLAWVADPLFWQAGNLWRRSPQIRVGYAADYDGFLVGLALAMLSPADAGSPVDWGNGNRSRRPDLEGRLSLGFRMDKTKVAEVGVSYHTNVRRYPQAAPAEPVDLTDSIVGVDAEFNILQYVTVKGEWYSGKGTDDIYAGIAPGVNATTATAPFLVRSSGFWAQAVLKPVEILNLTIGYGSAEGKQDDYTGLANTNRQKNTQLAAGIIFNAGKSWKFGLEGIQTESTYWETPPTPLTTKKGQQLALSSKLDF